MRKMRLLSKRGLALFLALVMCLSTLQLTAFADGNEPSEEENLWTCGLEEHVHTEACYRSEIPLCGLEETASSEDSDSSEDDSSISEDKTDGLDEEDPDETDVEDGENQIARGRVRMSEGTEGTENTEGSEETEGTENTEDSENTEGSESTEGSKGTEGTENTTGHTHTDSCYISEEPLCGQEEHTHHTLECWYKFEELSTALQEMNDALGAFQEEFEYTPDEDAEDPWAAYAEAFAAAAAERFGEQFNALLELYKSIPESLQDTNEESAYASVKGAMEYLAAALGGDLDNGIQTLAEGPRHVIMYSFPRDGAGWSLGTVWNDDNRNNDGLWNIHAVEVPGAYWSDYKTAYCIEPKVHQTTDNSGFEQSSYNSLSREQKTWLKKILAYGYTGPFLLNAKKGTDDDAMAKSIATQLLIWDVVTGTRNADTFEVARGKTSYYDKCIKNSDNPLKSKVKTAYNEIISKVNVVLPSFYDGRTIELEYKDGQYTATVEDTIKF